MNKAQHGGMASARWDLLTPDELQILDLLAEAARRFFALPEHHPSDPEEFAHEMHLLQHRVMCRAAIRSYPNEFTPLRPLP